MKKNKRRYERSADLEIAFISVLSCYIPLPPLEYLLSILPSKRLGNGVHYPSQAQVVGLLRNSEAWMASIY